MFPFIIFPTGFLVHIHVKFFVFIFDFFCDTSVTFSTIKHYAFYVIFRVSKRTKAEIMSDFEEFIFSKDTFFKMEYKVILILRECRDPRSINVQCFNLFESMITSSDVRFFSGFLI